MALRNTYFVGKSVKLKIYEMRRFYSTYHTKTNFGAGTVVFYRLNCFKINECLTARWAPWRFKGGMCPSMVGGMARYTTVKNWDRQSDLPPIALLPNHTLISIHG